MAKAATTELERQIEEVRREAHAAGYSAAMQAIRDAATPLAPDTRTTVATSSRRGRGRARPAARTAQPSRRRPAAIGATRTRRSAPRPPRGTNALIIEEILKAMAPSPVRPAEIRKALQDNGVTISFASIRNALRQLEAHNAAEQAGDSRTWRYRGGAA
jgi:hypothetical protein